MSEATRNFDFLVIGAPQSGTTSLWRGFDSHPQIWVPGDKERGYFNSDSRYDRGLTLYMEWAEEAGDDAVVGTVTPQLMEGDGAGTEMLVARIGKTCPDVKLLAILRNPLERAVSNFRRSRRVRGWPDDDFDAATERLARETDGVAAVPFIRSGEYGRIFRHYLSAFDRDQIKIVFSAALDSEPGTVYREAFSFLGVDPDHDAGSPRMNVGGTRTRIGGEALGELIAEVDRAFEPGNEEARRGYKWWLQHVWNAEPDNLGLEVSDDLAKRLAELYLADGELLRDLLGVEIPWRAELLAQVSRGAAE